MARYEHLPLFKSVYDFSLYFYKLSKNFPRDYRYGLAQEIRDMVDDLIKQIITINNMKSKTKYFRKAELTIEIIKIKLRLLKDMEVMGLKSYEYTFKSLFSISKQLNNWKAWSLEGRS